MSSRLVQQTLPGFDGATEVRPAAPSDESGNQDDADDEFPRPYKCRECRTVIEWITHERPYKLGLCGECATDVYRTQDTGTVQSEKGQVGHGRRKN